MRILWVIVYVDHYSQWPVLITAQCAAKILGMRDPRATYDQFDVQTWRNKLQAELHASGHPSAIHKLTIEMIASARTNALLSEGDTVFRQLREMRIVYECVLLQYGLPSFHLVPADENSLLRASGSKPNTRPHKKPITEPVRYPRPFWIRGVG